MIGSYIILLMTACYLVFSSTGSSIGNAASTTKDATIENLINNGYIITRGIGAHKYHRRNLKWNDARKMCVSEGAHLAVVNSRYEESIINRYRAEFQLGDLWIGYHDQFEKDDWVSVSDESLNDVGYSHWAPGEPNNGDGNERCVSSHNGGMNDLNCITNERAFVCKIYLHHHNDIYPSYNETNTAS